MLIFRLFAPIVWPALAFHWIKDARRNHGRLRYSYIFFLTVVSLTIYSVLKFFVPVQYTGGSLFLVYSFVDWLPVLLLPFLWTAISVKLRKEDADISAFVWAQWLVLWIVSWIDALAFSGLWQPFQLFVYPLMLIFLGMLPPLLFCRVYERWRFRHAVWLVFPLAASAAGGVQLLFRYQRWILGSIACAALLALSITVIMLLQKDVTEGVDYAEAEFGTTDDLL